MTDRTNLHAELLEVFDRGTRAMNLLMVGTMNLERADSMDKWEEYKLNEPKWKLYLYCGIAKVITG